MFKITEVLEVGIDSVLHNCKYIATDKGGEVYAYSIDPQISDYTELEDYAWTTEYRGCPITLDVQYTCIGRVGYEGDFRDSKIQIDVCTKDLIKIYITTLGDQNV